MLYTNQANQDSETRGRTTIGMVTDIRATEKASSCPFGILLILVARGNFQLHFKYAITTHVRLA
eukprot:2406241-Amphidinium_carterae.1